MSTIPLRQSRITPASATAGATAAKGDRGWAKWAPPRLRPSLARKLALLVAIFIAVPIILYAQFRAADQDKRTLLLKSVQEQGRLFAEVLRPILAQADPAAPPSLGDKLEELAGDDIKVRLLYRPAEGGDPSTFFYMASAPKVPVALLQAEREKLIELGVLDKLAESCVGEPPPPTRYVAPSGDEEIVTSVTPIRSDSGCWAVVIAHSTAAYQRSSIGRPYWMTPEIRFATLIYVALALLTIAIFVAIWRSLNRFARLARDIRIRGINGQTFASRNRLREMAGVAAELDRLVDALEKSSRTIRQAAEQNAHAFNAPVAVISQAVEPLKRIVPDDNPRGRRALAMIENSVERLDELIICARRMDEMVADLIDPPRHDVDLSLLLRRVIDGNIEVLAGGNLSLMLDIDDGIVVKAGEDLLETVIENLVENSVGFCSERGTIVVSLKKEGDSAVMTVEDNGPGVAPGEIERIFDRYYSRRAHPAGAADAAAGGDGAGRHFGIGLWIVRRNIEAVGGTVRAENRPGGGLRIRIDLPLSG